MVASLVMMPEDTSAVLLATKMWNFQVVSFLYITSPLNWIPTLSCLLHYFSPPTHNDNRAEREHLRRLS